MEKLVKPIHEKVKQVTGDSAYDTNPTYHTLARYFPTADIVISPQKDAVTYKNNEFFRNRNILEIEYHGRMGWQKRRHYERRNNSEVAIQSVNVSLEINSTPENLSDKNKKQSSVAASLIR